MIHKDGEITSTLSVLYCATSTLFFLSCRFWLSSNFLPDFSQLVLQHSSHDPAYASPLDTHYFFPEAQSEQSLDLQSSVWWVTSSLPDLPFQHLTRMTLVSSHREPVPSGRVKGCHSWCEINLLPAENWFPSQGKNMTEGKFVAAGISQACNCHAEKFQRFTSASDTWCLCLTLTPCLISRQP